MGRVIRMSAAQAAAAGLIDPEVADLARKALAGSTRQVSLPDAGAKMMQDGSAAHGSPKKKRSRSRPASYPINKSGPNGTGQVFLLDSGSVHAAEFELDLVPVPKERAQIVKNPKTDQVFGYTPARTRHFHEAVKAVIRTVMGERSPIEGPVRLEMIFAMQVPKSWPKWKQEAAVDGLIAPTGRPDMDNLEKALLDAFNGTLITDDAFVIDRSAKKVYGALPSIRVRVEQTGHFDIHARREAVEALRKLKKEMNDDDA